MPGSPGKRAIKRVCVSIIIDKQQLMLVSMRESCECAQNHTHQEISNDTQM